VISENPRSLRGSHPAGRTDAASSAIIAGNRKAADAGAGDGSGEGRGDGRPASTKGMTQLYRRARVK
jgi:hypothetical protein